MNVFNPLIDEKGEDFNANGKIHRGYYSDIEGKMISFQPPEFPLNRGDIITRVRDGAKVRVESTDLRKNADDVVVSFAAKVVPL
jgi:hypothetical protein